PPRRHHPLGRASHEPGDDGLRSRRRAQFRAQDRRRRPGGDPPASRRDRRLPRDGALMAPLLEVRGLRAFYAQAEVLHGLDFAIEGGGITTTRGATGAGKTTTLRAVCGMVRTQGEISFAARRIDGHKTEEIARGGIAHVPDGRGTFLELTTEE